VGGHVNERFLCFGVDLSVLDRSDRGPNFLWVVWIQYEMEALQKEKGKAYFMLIFPDIIPLNFCTVH
jgi:hypothetical protein